MNNLIVIIVILVSIYYFFFYKTENMTNVEPQQQQVIDQIYNYIVNNTDITLGDYINFLTSIKNTNLSIIDNEVFVTFKLLQKKNMFSKNDIISAMKL